MSNPRPVWVTGAGGFIGRAVWRRLRAEGREVRALLRNPPAMTRKQHDIDRRDPAEAGARTIGPRDSAPAGAGAPLAHAPLVCDLEKENALGVLQGEPPPLAIVHLAAVIPGAGNLDPDELAARNRRIDAGVFEFAARASAAVVFASSGSVYGEGHGQTFVEGGPTAPQSPYAMAKLCSESEGAKRLAAAGCRFTALRISAPYGPGQRARTVTSIFMERALQGHELGYHGSGSRMQDFVYVDDVAAAIACCLRARSPEGVFNVASGAPITMKALAALVAEIGGNRARVVASGRPDPQENRTALYSIEAARRALAWTPTTPLRRGLQLWRDELAGGRP